MSSKKHQCMKCSKILCSKRSLNNHKKRRVPCDYQCRLCIFIGRDRHHYYRHMKKMHPSNKPKKNESTQLVPKKSIEITPIEDFRRFVIEDKDMKISIKVEAKTLKGKLRLEKMLEQMAPGGIMQVLRQLDSDNDQFLDNTLTGMLSMVHSQPEVPQLHSICLSDIARRSVSFYSRGSGGDKGDDDSDCKWVVHPQESSIHILTQHARDLFSCLMTAGLAALTIQVCDDDIILTMSAGKRILVISYDRSFDTISVRTERYNPELFLECPESRSAEAAELLEIIEQRRDQVLLAVKSAIPKREHIKFFLDHGRAIHYPTFQASN